MLPPAISEIHQLVFFTLVIVISSSALENGKVHGDNSALVLVIGVSVDLIVTLNQRSFLSRLPSDHIPKRMLLHLHYLTFSSVSSLFSISLNIAPNILLAPRPTPPASRLLLKQLPPQYHSPG